MPHQVKARRRRGIGLHLLFAALVLGCGQGPRDVPGPASGELPDQEVSDFVVTETDAGRP